LCAEDRIDKGFFPYGPGSPDAMIHNDHLATPQKMTDSTGTVVWAADYKPFGEATITVSTITNNLRFPGQYFDAETGLNYNNHRDYNPVIGRYPQADPIGLNGGINLYVYVGNNPVNRVDPLGLTWSSNLSFLFDWATGGGWGNNRFYGPGTVEIQEMRNSPGGNALRDAFYANGCKDRRGFSYGSGQAAWDTLLNPLTADWSGTGAQVGGFAGASATNNGNGTVTFTIPNVAGTYSFFYHAVPDRSGSTGAMRNINQTFQWTENINASACKCSK